MPYKGSISNIPDKWALCNGSNGTPDLTTGRFLEGSSSAGSFKDAGLPNITGTVDRNYSGKLNVGNGAFVGTTAGNSLQIGTSGTALGPSILNFDASKSNSIYGASSTVQPKSYTVQFIMKIKA